MHGKYLMANVIKQIIVKRGIYRHFIVIYHISLCFTYMYILFIFEILPFNITFYFYKVNIYSSTTIIIY